MARGQEYFLSVLDKRYKTYGTSKYHGPNNYSKNILTNAKSPGEFNPSEGSTVKQGSEGFRKLTYAEISEKKQKGLCFHCDKKI